MKNALRLTAARFADGIERVGLETSVANSVVVATKAVISRRVAARTSTRLRPAMVGKMLGCGTRAGNRRCVSVLKSRLKRYQSRLPRVQRLRKSGAPATVWVRTAGTPAALYGVEVTGVSDSHLLDLRRTAVAAASAPASGEDVLLSSWAWDAAGASTDPAFVAHEAPIHAYGVLRCKLG